ncbi:putative 30S ribosomal protein S1 [Candidatus Karelsulcia muelleri CARI]|uniref:Putative 30S ribosomal protein S1 n=1 Tax=Karelsulcia muelleri (strain CARI) TaxID=706194 RepID=E0TJ68_KARMC|nr:putative 30S ribosomal protein S1 [Candidatus Karelsulcia muelleri CARI]
MSYKTKKQNFFLLEDLKNFNKNVKLSIFDWKSYELGLTKKEQKERKKLEKFYSYPITRINEYYVYNGKIIKIIDRNVVIDIGFKAEGIISLNEFREYKKKTKVNDIIEVIVEKIDYKGQCLISYNKAKKIIYWESIQKSFIKNEKIIFLVIARTKGGLIVILFGIECFLPGSQIDIKPVKDFDYFVGKIIEGKVVKINNKTKNVVVSHKILIEKKLEKSKKKLISILEKGQVLRGIVKNLTHYGSFIDVGGGIDGLCHITDISWERIEHPSEKLEIGQIMNFVILSIDNTKNRLQLGLKQLQSHPWNSLEKKIKTGEIVKGTVTVITDYGAFVEIFPGVEGLVHVSEMSWAQQLRSAQYFVKIGDKIKVLILNYSNSEKKMSLSMKRLTPDPWENIEKKYKLGSIHIGTVKIFNKIGVRLELEAGIEGLLYTSDISWIKKLKQSSEIYKKGDLVKVIVLGLDVITRRLNLGCKQLIQNPWEKLKKEYPIGSLHTGQIIKILKKGVIVKFNNLIIGAFAPIRFFKTLKLRKNKRNLIKILEYNKKLKIIYVSNTERNKKIKKKNVYKRKRKKFYI